MEIYHCKCCDYKSNDTSNFKKHLASKKHIEKFKRRVYKCETCGSDFFSRTLRCSYRKKL